MKRLLNFLIEVGKLKKMPRTGLVRLEIKNPETIGQHTFRLAILNWILAEMARPRLNIERVIKISLSHDLCKVYTGDVTPYGGLLPKDEKKRKEVLKRWVRLPQKIKEKRDKNKFEKEKKALEKLIKNLTPDLQKEIMDCWLDYERMETREGKFVKQGDKIETLLQVKEYWPEDENSPVFGWWEKVNELVDHPILLEFLEEIKSQRKKRVFLKKGTFLDDILDFLIKIDKLKQIPRTGLVFRGVKDPETIGEQTFRTAIMTWVFGERKKINIEKSLKIALCHEICEVYAGDATPYDSLLPKPREELKKMFLNPSKYSEKEKKEIIEYLNEMYKIWPKFPKKEKEKIFRQDYKNEKKALLKLTKRLPSFLKKEIINLWDDFKRQLTREGKFVNQVYWLQHYFQVLEYLKEDPKFPIRSWREQILHYIDDSDLIEFLKELEEKFYPKL